MGLTKQLRSQSSLVRHGVALPPWWTLATILAAASAAVALIIAVLAPSAPTSAFPAADPVPTATAQPSTNPTAAPDAPAADNLDPSLDAFVLTGPLQADGRLVQVTGPTGGPQALEANLVTTASAAALAQFSEAVAAKLPVTASPVTPSSQASTLSVSKVEFTGMSSGAYVFTVTVVADGDSSEVAVAVTDTPSGYKVLT